jgi:hypothetical protein
MLTPVIEKDVGPGLGKLASSGVVTWVFEYPCRLVLWGGYSGIQRYREVVGIHPFRGLAVPRGIWSGYAGIQRYREYPGVAIPGSSGTAR